MTPTTLAKKEARKSVLLMELANPQGEKSYDKIATKYHWGEEYTKEAMAEVIEELEHINTFNRARIAIKASPGAIDRIIDGANTEYTEPDQKLKAWREGLRTVQALDPKLRTVQHEFSANVTIDLKGSIGSALGYLSGLVPNVVEGLEQAEVIEPTIIPAEPVNV